MIEKKKKKGGAAGDLRDKPVTEPGNTEPKAIMRSVTNMCSL
jgi:hypothetical protein